MTQQTRTERRRQRTHDALIEAGYRLVGELGVHSWPIAEVAERADVALGSFYNHFADRDEFLDALVKRFIFDAMDDLLRRNAANSGDIAGRTANQFSDLVDRALDSPNYRSFIVAVGAFGLANRNAASREVFARIAAARTAGEISCLDIGSVMSATFGLVLSIYRHIDWLVHNDPDAIDRAMLRREAVRMGLAILGVSNERMAEIDAELIRDPPEATLCP